MIPIEEMPLYPIIDSRNTLHRPEWSGKFREDEKAALRKTGVWFAEDLLRFEGDRLVVSEAYRGEPIIVAGYYQDYRYYRGRKDFVSRLLKTPPSPSVPCRQDIVLNFRGSDLSWAQMPPSYYRWILDRERFERYATPMLAEKEFFIRKAIGWVLRETAKKDPAYVAAWTRSHLAQMSGVTFTEVAEAAKF